MPVGHNWAHTLSSALGLGTEGGREGKRDIMTRPDRARLKARNLELFQRLEDLKEIALDCLGGSAPKELPPFSGGTASEGEASPRRKKFQGITPFPGARGASTSTVRGDMTDGAG